MPATASTISSTICRNNRCSEHRVADIVAAHVTIAHVTRACVAASASCAFLVSASSRQQATSVNNARHERRGWRQHRRRYLGTLSLRGALPSYHPAAPPRLHHRRSRLHRTPAPVMAAGASKQRACLSIMAAKYSTHAGNGVGRNNRTGGCVISLRGAMRHARRCDAALFWRKAKTPTPSAQQSDITGP